MEGRRLLGVMPLNGAQLPPAPLGILTPGTTDDFNSISVISCFHQDNQYGLCSQSASCSNVMKPMNRLIAVGPVEDLCLVSEPRCDKCLVCSSSQGIFYVDFYNKKWGGEGGGGGLSENILSQTGIKATLGGL